MGDSIAKECTMLRSKKCFKCENVKPMNEFYIHTQMADGHLNKCKECARNDALKHREKNIEKIREYDRVRGKQAHRILSTAKFTKKWRNEDKRRSICHSKVNYAIKKGILKKEPCEICGNSLSVAHHFDYEKPLDVQWLCHACHRQLHINLKMLNSFDQDHQAAAKSGKLA